MRRVIAIDMGGTKTAVGVFDADGGQRARSVEPTDTRSPQIAVRALAERAHGLAQAEQADAVAMAMPAVIDPQGRVAWAAASVGAWKGTDAAEALRSEFGLPTAVLFDGYAATLGEATYGAGRGRSSMVTLIVGTGFGAGIWLDGCVVHGQTGVAGAVGWNRWPTADGSLSLPAEEIASGTGILRAARMAGDRSDYPDTRTVFDRANAGDAHARTAIERAAMVAGTVAGQIIDLLAPELVVWSGGVGSRVDFSDLATSVAQQSCQPYAVTRTQFTRSRLGAESSLVGAAAKALSLNQGKEPT